MVQLEQEREDRQLAGIQGPVNLETTTGENASPFYMVEVMAGKSTYDTTLALNKMRIRTQIDHKNKAVYRIHADSSQELIGTRMAENLETRGIMVAFATGLDSNANGRAERAARWVKDKIWT